MWNRGRVVAAVAVGALSGCAAPLPPPPPQQALLAAYPGQDKPEGAFRADDAACQAGAAQGVVAAPGPAPLRKGAAPRRIQPAPAQPEVDDGTGPGAPDLASLTPGQLYLRCMVARGNVVQPVAATNPVAYAYYAPYPVYAFGDYSPWLYGGFFGFGLGYGGFYRGYGYGGYGYRGYGYRGYGYRGFGFRDGFRDGGFREGRGFEGGRGGFGGERGGGGFRGGGFGRR